MGFYQLRKKKRGKKEGKGNKMGQVCKEKNLRKDTGKSKKYIHQPHLD